MEISEDELAKVAEAYLRKAYVARADDRQKAMGLDYITAETRDLAKFVVRFARQYETATFYTEDRIQAIRDAIDPPPN